MLPDSPDNRWHRSAHRLPAISPLSTFETVTGTASDGRYDVARAPYGLGFVEDLINTVGRGPLPDQLATLRAARAWLDAAVTAWAHDRQTRPDKIGLIASDLPELRDLRDDVHRLLANRSTAQPRSHGFSGDVSFALRSTGSVEPQPKGRGAEWAAATVALEIYEAQTRGTWPRLKVCANPVCQVAFYDLSRNSNAVWHSLRLCGNAINLRAHRARHVSSK